MHNSKQMPGSGKINEEWALTTALPWPQWKVNFSAESYQYLSVAKASAKSKVDRTLILIVLVHIYNETDHAGKIFILT